MPDGDLILRGTIVLAAISAAVALTYALAAVAIWRRWRWVSAVAQWLVTPITILIAAFAFLAIWREQQTAHWAPGAVIIASVTSLALRFKATTRDWLNP